jgi:hypothetical protein
MLKRMLTVAVAVAISALTYAVPANADISPPTWTPVSFHVTGHDDLVTQFETFHSEWDWEFTPTGPGTDDGAGFISGIPLASTGSVSAHDTLTFQFTSCQIDEYWVGSATPFTATMAILYSTYNLNFGVHLDPYTVEHQIVYSGNTGAPDNCSNDVLTETLFDSHVPGTPNGCATIGCNSEWSGSAPLAPNQEAVSGEIVDDRTGPDGGKFETVQYSFKRSICTGVDTDGDGVPDCNESSGGTQPSPKAQITPTSTTCNQFAAGTATSLSSLQYSLKNGKINQVNPGVFFYWVQVPAGGTYTITQALSTNTLKSFSIANGSFAYDGNCTKLNAKPVQDNAGTVTVSFTATGTSYIGIKYNASSLVGEFAPSPSTVSYQFATTQVTGSTRGLDLTIKK